ncbi:MAG: hypothetical protein ACK4SO_03520 [Candidatus Kapaibacteriota bacterium]
MNRSLDYQRLPQGRQKQISVRNGEIIRGRIIDVISPRQAVISLPDGTFTAEITGKFKPGDELFFRVQSAEPTLILKIHSLYVSKDNKELSTNEILRILDLPRTNLFEKIIDSEKSKLNLLVRDDIILMAKYAQTLTEKYPKENIGLILRFLEFSLKNLIMPETQLYFSFTKIFDFGKVFNQIMNFLLSNPKLLPEENRRKILDFPSIFNQRIDTFSFLQLFSPNFSHTSDNFFNTLVGALNQLDLSTDIKSIFTELKSILNYLWAINSASVLSGGNTIFLIIPYIQGTNLRYSVFRYRKKVFGSKQKETLTLDDEEAIEPIASNLENELRQFFSSQHGKQLFQELVNSYKRTSTREGDKIIIKSPFGTVQVVRILFLGGSGQASVSIVI